ncbi:MAG TPA: exosome complex RNA-binding protein Csl4 [Thermoplasmata archaeon]|nr:exosome complex RNA-binding protein Csl4 [Thermoplasmata archaeon]
MSEPGSDRLVLPGELLGTAEEFVPGRGTYEDNGRIYAALLGHPKVDPSDRAIRVDALNAIPNLTENDTVYGRVDEIKAAMAIVTIVAAAPSGRGVPGNPEGTIHISKAKDGYTETLADEFAPGDVVLAKLIQHRPTIKLTTAPSFLGVVAARCQLCHALLAKHGHQLECPRCGHQERRKMAADYGQVLVPPAASGPAESERR